MLSRRRRSRHRRGGWRFQKVPGGRGAVSRKVARLVIVLSKKVSSQQPEQITENGPNNQARSTQYDDAYPVSY